MSRNNKPRRKFDLLLVVRKFFVSAFVLFTFIAYAVHERFTNPDGTTGVLPPPKDASQTQLLLVSPHATSVPLPSTPVPTTAPIVPAATTIPPTPMPVVASVASVASAVPTSTPIIPTATDVIPATAVPLQPTVDTTPRVTAINNANVRNGDGTNFDIINTLPAGQSANILGISSLNSGWYLIQLSDGSEGWISPSVVNVSGNLAGVAQVQPPAPPAPTAAPQSGQYINGQYTGDVEDAYYGNVQVSVTIQNGQISDVQFLDYPHDRRTSQQINAIAMPYLQSEAIQAQSAYVNIISGATLTSEAFAQSLQTALQRAKANA